MENTVIPVVILTQSGIRKHYDQGLLNPLHSNRYEDHQEPPTLLLLPHMLLTLDMRRSMSMGMSMKGTVMGTMKVTVTLKRSTVMKTTTHTLPQLPRQEHEHVVPHVHALELLLLPEVTEPPHQPPEVILLVVEVPPEELPPGVLLEVTQEEHHEHVELPAVEEVLLQLLPTLLRRPSNRHLLILILNIMIIFDRKPFISPTSMFSIVSGLFKQSPILLTKMTYIYF